MMQIFLSDKTLILNNKIYIFIQLSILYISIKIYYYLINSYSVQRVCR